eukprot:5923424-Alexandrium_andersonii.AAC.1
MCIRDSLGGQRREGYNAQVARRRDNAGRRGALARTARGVGPGHCRECARACPRSAACPGRRT